MYIHTSEGYIQIMSVVPYVEKDAKTPSDSTSQMYSRRFLYGCCIVLLEAHILGVNDLPRAEVFVFTVGWR